MSTEECVRADERRRWPLSLLAHAGIDAAAVVLAGQVLGAAAAGAVGGLHAVLVAGAAGSAGGDQAGAVGGAGGAAPAAAAVDADAEVLAGKVRRAALGA